MKAKSDQLRSLPIFTYRYFESDNDRLTSNRSNCTSAKKNEYMLKPKQNITWTEESSNNLGNTDILLGCIEQFEKQISQKQEAYELYISSLKNQVYQKQLEGRCLYQQLRYLRAEMDIMNQEVFELSVKLVKRNTGLAGVKKTKAYQSPYQLAQKRNQMQTANSRSLQSRINRHLTRSRPKKNRIKFY